MIAITLYTCGSLVTGTPLAIVTSAEIEIVCCPSGALSSALTRIWNETSLPPPIDIEAGPE